MSFTKLTTDLQWQISRCAAWANKLLVISVWHYYLAYAGAADGAEQQ